MFEIACYCLGNGRTCSVTTASYFTANSTHNAIGSSSRFVFGRECEPIKKPRAGLPEFSFLARTTGESPLRSELICAKSRTRNAREIGRECGLLAKEQPLRHSSGNGDVAEWLKAAVC